MPNKELKEFWEQVEKNKKEVATWPEWKQRIIITAETAGNGQYYKDSNHDNK